MVTGGHSHLDHPSLDIIGVVKVVKVVKAKSNISHMRARACVIILIYSDNYFQTF